MCDGEMVKWCNGEMVKWCNGEMVRWCNGEMVRCAGNVTTSPSHPNNSQLAPSHHLTILIGLQPKRDFMKGAMKIAMFVEEVARRHPGKVQIKYEEGVPYDEYMRLLAEADVLVDQLYSYTPSMNSLAAMARGTVVIGGGEEEYYEFIGEDTLRPIINVRPDVQTRRTSRRLSAPFSPTAHSKEWRKRAYSLFISITTTAT